MNVLVNGEARQLPDHTTVRAVAPAVSGVAVAVNGTVVRAADWATTLLQEGDRVEVVTAQQGG